ncbi:hypothetical protein BC939DRAFT_221418 [Gamsiella multidivaricata]|uniref:uncharacterized protein n=1 Tax=Gamsiella multidivaricata TaxID=101098 RepID=UPI0022206C59|nr:uncharacterized protein BC939DRAFT_221418 [Gamsiella multidivaricata]KAG0362660.1 hypothetical protein BGZ54_008547 [Gamsiella multidivaricata]KAI7831161.1 hypothetical protein BC939DRAFT_221418 [Gamsiella multidivaricata]
MVNGRSSTPPHRTQRALSVAADTRKARGTLYISSEYPYAHPYPPSPSIPDLPSCPQKLPKPAQPAPLQHDPAQDSFFHFDQFQRTAPSVADQKKDDKVAQRQRREQIVQKLQQQQIEAQERARQEKIEKQQIKLEQKQARDEAKQFYRAQYDQASQKDSREKRQQRSAPIQPFPNELSSPYLHDAHPLYHQDASSNLSYDCDDISSSSAKSRSSRHVASNNMRSLSLKSTTKSMYDLRPWSGGPQSPTQGHHTEYESDERSHGWDSLMDTLYSPTLPSPSDAASWDSKDDQDQDLTDSMGALSFSHDYSDNGNGNGNGKYLLVLGANGRAGIELVKQGLERNYRVTAFVRDDKPLLEDSSLRRNQNLLIVRGSPTSQADVDSCVEGQDVVVNLIGARLMAGDPIIGSHSQVVLNNALKKHGVRRLVVVTSYGCLGLRNYLISTKRLFSRVFMTGILKDKVLQEDIVQRDSEFFDWTIVRPITLKDGDLSERYWVSSEELPKANKVKQLSRKDLAHYILTIINRPQDYKAIRSIAGKPKSSKQKLSCPSERRRDPQELARHQQELAKGYQERGGY